MEDEKDEVVGGLEDWRVGVLEIADLEGFENLVAWRVEQSA